MKATRNIHQVLVVDDDEQVLTLVKRMLGLSGYKVLAASNGEDALSLFGQHMADFIILDIMLPDVDGFELCKRIREFSLVPIIMLTGKIQESDVIKGFELGADDYVVKPFSAKELLARVKAVLHRSRVDDTVLKSDIFCSYDLEIDFSKRRVRNGNQQSMLTPTEYRLLKELVRNKGKVLTHTYLLQHVWGPEYRDETEYLHVLIRRLRMKIEADPSRPQYIRNMSGTGYEFKG